MARKSAAKSESETEEQTSMVLAGNDPLADVLGDEDLGITGVEEADASDVRLAKLIWNFKGVNEKTGKAVSPDTLFNTVTEETKDDARVALLVLHKSHEWKEFDEAAQKSERRCSSWDRVTGEMADGTRRSCEGCPDRQWTKNPETGKRTRRCSEVANVVGLDLEDGQPVVLRFRRTAARAWSDFLNKYILGKRIVNGRRQNMPLFAYPTEVSIKMEKKGNLTWALPVLERGEKPFSRDEILYFAESARGFKELYLDEMRHAAENGPDEDGDAPRGDSGAGAVSPGDFEDDDFPPREAAEPAANRF